MSTQNDVLLHHLRDVGSITQNIALREYGIARLAARVEELKDRRIRIATTYERVKTRYGFARIARYSLKVGK